MSAKKKPDEKPAPLLNSPAVIKKILTDTEASLAVIKAERTRKDEARRKAGKKVKPSKDSVSYAIHFAKHAGAAMAAALEEKFPGIQSGEIPSRAVKGPKRLDVSFGTREMGLGLGISLKSVHKGEEEGGDADFVHNTKRNDEEWRVESTSHHLRQPYAVMVAVVFLPFEAAHDKVPPKKPLKSSFAEWVEYLWPLKGRYEAEDAPDLFELVFVALYARDGSKLGFYQVGGETKCPRFKEPKKLLSFEEFLKLVTHTYNVRNGKDFFFEGEEPSS